VQAKDLRRYTQCHFFAGIGGWALALKQAQWGDKAVWTGSCPCQPFSTAGKKLGVKDERHLWPVWFNLIRECKPPIVFGEQVKNAISKNWLDIVFTDLEAENYACGAAVLPACSVGAPHRRDRIYWVADSNWQRSKFNQRGIGGKRTSEKDSERRYTEQLSRGGSAIDELANTNCRRRPQRDSEKRIQLSNQNGAVAGFWGNAEWLPCRDGKARPVESGTFPLAYGVSQRVGKLRAYGNAIVPQVAEAFLRAVSQ
jgi:DNA (cytosine-5)-methyltransferase 1